MRFLALALIFSVAGCDDSGNNNNNHQDDLSTSDDLASMNILADLSVVPDLTPLTPSGMIQQVRNAGASNTPDGGMLTMSIPVEDVFVTYLRPEISGETTDPPGFFVQADLNGPALFLRIDPATLSPVPQVGDQVSFTVTGAGADAGGVRQAISITDWTVISSGHSLTSITQDVSLSADLVSMVDNYESELIKVTGTVSGDFVGAGPAYVSANLATAGISTGTMPRLRLPSTLRDALDVTNGCQVTVGPTPLYRFNKNAEPSAWVSNDITIASCPGPAVVSALPASSTSVVLTFSRFIKPATLVADGSQFTFNNGLTASAATLTAANQITLTTSAQNGLTAYTVTVATSLTDLRNTAMDTTVPSGKSVANNQAVFAGFTPPATLIISEYNPNISNADVVELKATTGGSVAGFKLWENYSINKNLLSDLPNNLVVDAGDFIVVHLQSPAPSPMPVTTEFNVGNAVSKSVAQSQCSNGFCVPDAWDVKATTSSGIGFARRLLTVTGAAGEIQDAIAFTANTGGSKGTQTELQAAVVAGQWTTPCTNASAMVVSCGDDPNKSFDATDNALFDSSAFNVKPASNAVGTKFDGISAQRTSDIAHSGKGDWKLATQTWGKPTVP